MGFEVLAVIESTVVGSLRPQFPSAGSARRSLTWTDLPSGVTEATVPNLDQATVLLSWSAVFHDIKKERGGENCSILATTTSPQLVHSLIEVFA